MTGVGQTVGDGINTQGGVMSVYKIVELIGTSLFQRLLYFQNGFLNHLEIGERGHVRRKGL